MAPIYIIAGSARARVAVEAGRMGVRSTWMCLVVFGHKSRVRRLGSGSGVGRRIYSLYLVFDFSRLLVFAFHLRTPLFLIFNLLSEWPRHLLHRQKCQSLIQRTLPIRHIQRKQSCVKYSRIFPGDFHQQSVNPFYLTPPEAVSSSICPTKSLLL